MNKSGQKKISSRVKRQIVLESLMPGCIISKLALQYRVSQQSIYCWRKEYQELVASVSQQAQYVLSTENIPLEPNFVELPIINNKSIDCELEKASFIFNGFSFVIEGKVKVSSLCEILRILEESC